MANRARIARLVELAGPAESCAAECSPEWLADGRCDAPCNTPACAFDAGDCPTQNRGENRGDDPESEDVESVKRPREWVCVGEGAVPRGAGGVEAEEFVREGWGVTPEAFCVTRMPLAGSFIQMDVGEKVETRNVQSVVAVESGFLAVAGTDE